MAVLDLPVPAGVATPVVSRELRPSADATEPRSSSSDASARSLPPATDQTRELARLLQTSERTLGTARELLQRHLADAGEGQAGKLVATSGGLRPATINAAGLMARSASDSFRVGVALIADPLVLLAIGGDERALHWSLLPGGPSVGARADALRMIRSIAAGGHLTFRMGPRPALPALEIDGGDWADEDEWRLFEDLAVLEEWSGTTIPMPTRVSSADATAASSAASWVRSTQIEARLDGSVSFQADDPSVAGADEVRLHQDFRVELLGLSLPLGTGTARVPLDRVVREDSSSDSFEAWPVDPQMTFWLAPPASRRTPVRTQRGHVYSPNASAVAPSLGPTYRRPARSRVSDVLARRSLRSSKLRAADHPRGSAGLLDEIRGN